MGLGTETDIIFGESKQVEILASAVATNSAPSGTVGADLNLFRVNRGSPLPLSIRVGCVSTAGSGTMTVTLRVWLKTPAGWVVAKSLNSGSAIAETSADSLAYSEEVSLLPATRIYMEIVAIGGSSTAVTGYAWIQG